MNNKSGEKKTRSLRLYGKALHCLLNFIIMILIYRLWFTTGGNYLAGE